VGVARSTGTETILLVEDEAALVALAGRILERLGYVVLTALSPAAAIEIATAHPEPIHLLVTDVVMPDMSGRDVWNRLREIRPGLKCLFMSGYTAEVIAHSGVLDEGVNFLPKPFSVNALAGKVREALDH
jgi:DNA-binding NtrC family response regulator